MNEEIDRNLESRVLNLERWASSLEDDLKSAALLLSGVDAQADRLLQTLDELKRYRS